VRPDQVPDAMFDRADLPALVTGPHRAAELSASAYRSAETDAQIAHYQRVRDALRDGREPPPPPAAP
jgi:hypothetical protein